MPVATVVAMVPDGMSHDEIVAAYPDLERADIAEAVRYAATEVDAVAKQRVEMRFVGGAATKANEQGILCEASSSASTKPRLRSRFSRSDFGHDGAPLVFDINKLFDDLAPAPTFQHACSVIATLGKQTARMAS